MQIQKPKLHHGQKGERQRGNLWPDILCLCAESQKSMVYNVDTGIFNIFLNWKHIIGSREVVPSTFDVSKIFTKSSKLEKIHSIC